MSIFTKNPEDIFAGFDASGDARSVDNGDVVTFGVEIARAIDLLGTAVAGPVYATRSALNADLNYAENIWAIVTNDGADSGYYRKVGASGGGAWVWKLPLHSDFVIGTDAGAGTANAIEITTNIGVFEGVLLAFKLYRDTTGSPVTVTAGGVTYTLKTNRGGNVSGLTADMEIVGRIYGTEFRLWTDVDISALVAAAAASETASATSAGEAADSSTYAQEWAIKAEDVPVSVAAGGDGSTDFSAFHWAQKAFDAVGTNLVDNSVTAIKIADGAIEAKLGYTPANQAGDTFSGEIGQAVTGTAARGWSVRTRSTVTTFPVPAFRPTQVNTVLAIDLMPNGTPSESSGNGYAWLDVCNADIRDADDPVWGGRVAATSVGAVFGSFSYNGASAKPIAFQIGSSIRWYIDATLSAMSPYVDNGYSLGSSGQRVSVVYAGTGTINTSDRREKTDIARMSDAEHEQLLDVWAECMELLSSWRWIEAVERKGEDARLHFGRIAQDIKELFEANGMDATRYALLCHDAWEAKTIEHPAEYADTGLLDGRGNPMRKMVAEAWTETVVEAGERWGLRIDQCAVLDAAVLWREVKRMKASSGRKARSAS